MAITISPLTPPTIKVNGTALKAKEIKINDKTFTGTRDATLAAGDTSNGSPVPVFATPVTITFEGPAGATIRYTFNSKKVNLGSKKYRASNPPIVRNGGDGFDGDVLIIRAKAYKNGEASGTTEAIIHILNSGSAGRQASEEPNETKTYYGGNDDVKSRTGK